MRPSIVQGYKTSVWVFIVIVIISALIINGVETSRADLVRNHRSQICTIVGRDIQSSKSNSYLWTLSSQKDFLRRELRVSESEYESSKIGQDVPIFSSVKNPSVWEAFIPTEQWHGDLLKKEWLIFLGIVALLSLFFRAFWNEAKREVKRLNSAVITDADIIGLDASESRGALTSVMLRFKVRGEQFEGKFPTTLTSLGDHFETRTVQLAVNEDNPSKSRILSMFTLAELIPKH